MRALSSTEDAPYTLQIDEQDAEPFAFGEDITLGRDLDNDVVIAGEEVDDFHARIEIGRCSVDLVPLPGRVVAVEGRSIERRHSLMPGERFAIGLTPIRFDLARCDAHGQAPVRWQLAPAQGDARVAFEGRLVIGRGEGCGLKLDQRHISRQHAIITEYGGRLWLKDLDSANGTFVNGERLQGACWLVHGDVIAFDTESFQLMGDDPDLTAVTRFDATPPAAGSGELSGRATGAARDASIGKRFDEASGGTGRAPAATEAPGAAQSEAAAGGTPAADDDEPAPALLGVSDAVAGRRFPLGFGRYLIGRSEEADIRLSVEGVSQRHAELDRGPDGALISDLMSTNGTLVNGGAVHTVRLRHGDRLRFGRAVLRYHDPAEEAPAGGARWQRSVLLWVAAAATAVLLGLGAALLLLG